MLAMLSLGPLVACITALALLTACTPPARETKTSRPLEIAEELPPMQEVCSEFRAVRPADRLSWRFAQAAFPLDGVPRGAKLSALEQIATLRRLAPARVGPRWVGIGPAPLLINGRANAGRVATVAVDPSDAAHWLIGAAHGGIWETRNAGQRWEPRTDDKFSLAMGAIAFAPSNPKIVYAGTVNGELRRTTTGGGDANTWSPLDPNGDVAKRMVTSLAFHPTDANILLVTVGGFDQGTPNRPGHLFKTTNALAASPRWTRVSGTSNLPHNVVAFDPLDPQVIYVGTDVGLWYTTDGGAHWDHMGPERGLPNVAVSDIRVHPKTRRVFAFTFGRGVFVQDPAP